VPQGDIRVIFLRFLAFLIGVTIPMVPPLVLGDVGIRGMAGWSVLEGMFGLSLISGTFLYIALLAPRMRRSIALRVLGGILLMLPAAVSFVVLWERNEAEMLWCGGLLLVVTVLMFISFVFPATSDHRQRPMRARERKEPALP
jgi:hypothetical protein